MKDEKELVKFFKKNNIYVGNKILLFDDFEILYFEANGSFTIVHLLGNRHITSIKPINYYEKNSSYNFYRVHHKFLVNINQIRSIIKGKNTGVILADQRELPVSSRRKKSFFEHLDIN